MVCRGVLVSRQPKPLVFLSTVVPLYRLVAGTFMHEAQCIVLGRSGRRRFLCISSNLENQLLNCCILPFPALPNKLTNLKTFQARQKTNLRPFRFHRTLDCELPPHPNRIDDISKMVISSVIGARELFEKSINPGDRFGRLEDPLPSPGLRRQWTASHVFTESPDGVIHEQDTVACAIDAFCDPR
ncbi:hypothetical protein KC364_g19 [Hortaea werneckii]|nr:hypothetical protein KC364_g19 [Hortaea werneckii]